jgi:hypothetical protein
MPIQKPSMPGARRHRRPSLLLPAALLSLLMPVVNAQYTVESVAEEIARKHNAAAPTMLDRMTISTSAKAEGKNVILAYVLRVRKGLSAVELEAFKTGLDETVVAPACKLNADNDAFKLGLYYTFIYSNTYAEQLAKLVVSKATCDARP